MFNTTYLLELLYNLNWATLAVLGLGVLWVLWKVLNWRIYAAANAVRHKDTNQPIPTLSFWREMWMFTKIFFLGLVNHFDSISDTLEKGRKHGRLFNAWQGPDSVVIVSHPEDLAKWINPELFTKDRKFFKANYPLHKVFGESVVSTTGEKWQKQRTALQPCFRGDPLRDLVCAFSECADRLADEWEKRWDEKHDSNGAMTFPIYDDLSRLTIDAIGIAGFGHDFDSLRDACTTILKSYNIITKAVFKPMIKEWMFNLPLPCLMKLKRAWHDMDTKLEEIINAKKDLPVETVKEEDKKKEGEKKGEKEEEKPHFNILSHLVTMSQSGDEKNKLDWKELRDNLLIFMVAGHDTCTSTLVSAFYFLALHPEVQEKVYEEVKTKLTDGTVTDHCNLIELKYTRQVIKEVIRLHPPVDRTNYRVAIHDIQLGDYNVPAGTKVMPLIPLTNYSEELWKEPKKFDPDRWGDKKHATNERIFMSFSSGDRTCLGKKFSILEVMATMAMLVYRFQFTLMPNFEWKSRPITVCLRPVDGLPLQIKKRGNPKPTVAAKPGQSTDKKSPYPLSGKSTTTTKRTYPLSSSEKSA